MRSNWLKPNQYEIKNGKLIPRSSTPTQEANYRYIPYNPLNKPTEQDYYKETINKLTKENNELKKIVNELTLIPQQQQQFHKGEYEKKINNLSNILYQRDDEIRFRQQQFIEMDQIIINQGQQLQHLHQMVSGLNIELEQLKNILIKRDQQINMKNQAINEYEKTIAEMMKNQIRKNTTISSQNSQSQKEEEQMQFHTLQGRSWTEKHTVSQRNIHHEENEEKYSENSELSENLKNWTQWAGKGKYSTFDLIHDNTEVDKMAGSLSGLLSSFIDK